MKSLWKFLIVPLLACSLLAGGKAEAKNALISGLDIDTTVQADLTALGWTSTIVDPLDLTSTDFTGYDAIWLGWGSYFPGLNFRQADLLSFVQNGGNVLAELSDPINDLTDYPFGSELTTLYNPNDSVHITAPGDPVNKGLTDAGLSNWIFSYLDVFTDIGSFQGLSVSADDPTQWVTFRKGYGHGNFIYTGQAISFHIKFSPDDIGPFSQKGTFLVNALGAPDSTVPEPGSLALLVTGAGPLLVTLRRRRMGRR